jgi:hypothetical protein
MVLIPQTSVYKKWKVEHFWKSKNYLNKIYLTCGKHEKDLIILHLPMKFENHAMYRESEFLPFISCKLRSVESVPSLIDWTKYNSEVLIDYHLSAYISAAVSIPDVSGAYFSCYIHTWCVTDIPQLWRIFLTNQAWIQQLKNTSDRSSMNTAAEEYPWQIRHGYSSWSISLTHQVWIQQL